MAIVRRSPRIAINHIKSRSKARVVSIIARRILSEKEEMKNSDKANRILRRKIKLAVATKKKLATEERKTSMKTPKTRYSSFESAIQSGSEEKNLETSNGVEVCISFDTTGSMYSCLDEVRRSVKATIKRLLKDIPSIRIALVAHGDYGDEKTTYLIKTLDHTSDEDKLVEWVNNVERTNGFDSEECYELVLRDIQRLSWTPTCRNRSLVLIGDSNPHPLIPKNRNPYQIDWRKEAEKLKDMNIRVYAVHALNQLSSKNFYQSLASITNGSYLNLPQFDSIVDFLCGICYRQNDPSQVEAYEKELRTRRGGELDPAVRALFDNLLGREATAAVAKEGGIKPVPRERFRTLYVDKSGQIKSFITRKGLNFKIGHGFYQFTKPEHISMKKEIILQHKKTGDIYTGKSARLLLGITDFTSARKVKITPTDFMGFNIFVKSTSYNRNLMGGTYFMYEVTN